MKTYDEQGTISSASSCTALLIGTKNKSSFMKLLHVSLSTEQFSTEQMGISVPSCTSPNTIYTVKGSLWNRSLLLNGAWYLPPAVEE